MINKKYSIMVPVYNGMPYLESCLNTILSQPYEDFELIVSDDHSTDGSTEYLKTLSDPRLRVVFPEQGMSMTEHWEWALSHAEGQWQIFVGQDDGLQMHFFELADQLTSLAKIEGLRSIVSRRAYYFWPGCESYYGPWKIKFAACKQTSVRTCWLDALSALLGGSYHNLPQMYTSSLFKKELLDEAREKQDGKVFCAHPQDANLAAVACSLEGKYLRSEVPLGWVGSSIKSAGLAISSQTAKQDSQSDELKNLATDYKKKVAKSNFQYNPLAGDFSLGSTPVYFWQALLQTQKLRSSSLNNVLQSRFFRFALFSSVLAKDGMWNGSEEKKEMFVSLLHVNAFGYNSIKLMAQFLRLKNPLSKLVRIAFVGVPKRLKHSLSNRCYRYSVKHVDSPSPEMVEASEIISSEVKKRGIV